MAKPGRHGKPSPRAASLVKAARRQRTVVDGVLSLRSVPVVRAERPKVDFTDPLMRHAAMQAKGVGLCAFLVTLAAWQRGLKVTFHYERASFDARFASAKVQGYRGEVFSISDGRRAHVFSRTMGDCISPTANAIAEDKHLSKRALAQAGVRTPSGIVVERGQTTLVERFVARAVSHVPDRRFVVKPVAGSMGRDVHTDLPAERVLPAVQSIVDARIVVEEFIEGTEYRAFVAAGQCVASITREPPNVTGDGCSTIAALITRKNAERARNPRLASNPIGELDAVAAHLAQSGLRLDTVPVQGERIVLLPVASISRGGDPVDVTSSAPSVVAQAAVAACAAVGLDVAGVDLIVSGAGPDAQAYVIEVNQRPHIGSHSFPMEGTGQGNAVAESIVDFYFPESVGHQVHPALVYDFAAVVTAMDSAQLAEVVLPTIYPDWQVMRLNETGVTAKALTELIRTAAKAAGVHVMASPLPQGGMALCLAAAPANLAILLNLLPPAYRSRLQASASAVLT